MDRSYRVVLAGTYPDGTAEAFRRCFEKDETILFEVIDTPEAYAQLTRADCMILRTFRAERNDLARIGGLKMIQRWGVGVDSVDVEAASEKGIAVCNTPGANANAVSEQALALLLTLTRNIMRHTFSLRAGVWSKQLYTQQTVTLKDRTLGLVGGGNIGRMVAAKAQAFGAKVQYYDLFRLPEETETACRMTFVPFETLLQTSDVISLHVPLTKENHHMIGRAQLAQMKPGAYLINTARGGLVDEAALIDAIEEGRLAGAGIDCVEQEPLEAGSRLLQYPNIVVTPHVGGTSADIGQVMVPMIAENVRRAAHGEALAYVVNQAKRGA